MGRRSEHSRAELYDMVLQAAEQMIVSEGLRGLSTRKVAAAVGYTVGSLYLVFRNLDELIVRVNERTLDDLYRALQRAVADNGQDARAALRALGHAYIDYALTHSHRWQALFEHHLPAGESVPASLNQRVTRLFELVQEQLAPLAGPQSAADLALAASVLWSGVHGVCVLAMDQKLQSNSGCSVYEVADSLILRYLAGLLAVG